MKLNKDDRGGKNIGLFSNFIEGKFDFFKKYGGAERNQGGDGRNCPK